jgi:hypothetical protein
MFSRTSMSKLVLLVTGVLKLVFNAYNLSCLAVAREDQNCPPRVSYLRDLYIITQIRNFRQISAPTHFRHLSDKCVAVQSPNF